jgi:hypothetical protein
MNFWTSYVYVGHVYTRFATLCVFWTCIDGFDGVDVWIHVETEFDAQMWFICYIVVNKCGSVVYICDKCGLNARKQQK